MEREPGDFERRDDEAQPMSDEDARLEALIASMPPAPGIKHIDDDDDEDENEDFDDIEAAIAAGRAYPHEIVAEWLKTWGQPDQKPFKEWLADRDG